MRFATLLLSLCTTLVFAQPNTEVYLLDIGEMPGARLENLRNISENDGYDSQPYFLGKDALLFAGEVQGQTEIIQYARGKKKVFNAFTSGGEYSPQPIPKGRSISAVRLDTSGLQRLYRYKPRKKTSEVIVKDAVVAYYVWADENTIVSADIVSDKLNLNIHNVKTEQSVDFGIPVGRSFHKIPNTNLISFIDKSNPVWFIKSIDPVSSEIKTIVKAIPGTEDMCWLPDGTLLMARKNTIWQWSKKKDWSVFHRFENDDLQRISRIASSPDGSQLAVVSEVSPAVTVQKQVDAFNAKNLEDFVATFSQDVVVRNYPSDTLYKGRAALLDQYKPDFENKKNQQATVKTRLIHGDVVIDEELISSDIGSYRQATIYEVRNGIITSMTFIADDAVNPDPTAIVDLLTIAYNKGSAKKMMPFLSEDVSFFNYPSTLVMKSKETIGESYKSMFKKLPNLKATIVKRIVIGNLVIDKEQLTTSNNTWYALVINEVKDDKISKMIFIE